MFNLADSHVHLDDARFDKDRGDVLRRACQSGINVQIIPATHAASWESIRSLCQPDSGLFPAYGLHPMFMQMHNIAHLKVLSTWLEIHRPVAIGEIGLDFYAKEYDAEGQRGYFQQQLALAREFDLPIIVHARAAIEEVITTLRRVGNLRGVVHSFSGSLEQAQQLWKLGFYLGIGGPVTYERALRLRRIVTDMPLEYLLMESDAPDQPGVTHRGERNEPAYLLDTLNCIAQLRNQDPTHIAIATSNNVMRLFGISKP